MLLAPWSPEAFTNCHSFQVSSKPIDYVPPASAEDARSLPKEEFEGHRCGCACSEPFARQLPQSSRRSSPRRRSCQLTSWRGAVDAALSDGLTPLLLCPGTVYDELKALLSADASAFILDVKPLSPSGLRTKVPPPQRTAPKLCSAPQRQRTERSPAGQVPRLHAAVQVVAPPPPRRYLVTAAQSRHRAVRAGGAAARDRHGARLHQLQR